MKHTPSTKISGFGRVLHRLHMSALCIRRWCEATRRFAGATAESLVKITWLIPFTTHWVGRIHFTGVQRRWYRRRLIEMMYWRIWTWLRRICSHILISLHALLCSFYCFRHNNLCTQSICNQFSFVESISSKTLCLSCVFFVQLL